MFVTHDQYATPPDDTVIWRYMNIEQLLSLISRKRLHLSRLDQFPDKWECTWPKAIIDKWSGRGGFKVQHLLNTVDQRTTMFANCWHASPHQSAALWDRYKGRLAIGIKSTVGNLKVSLKDERRFHIAKVEYIDFHSADSSYSFGTMTPAFLKRKSFEFEQEVRVLMHDGFNYGSKPNLDVGKEIACDVEKLIEEVYVAPECDEWVLPCIKTLLEKFDLVDAVVKRSDLYDARIY